MPAGATDLQQILHLRREMQATRDALERAREDFRKIAVRSDANPYDVTRAFQFECSAREHYIHAIATLNQFLAETALREAEKAAKPILDLPGNPAPEVSAGLNIEEEKVAATEAHTEPWIVPNAPDYVWNSITHAARFSGR